MLRCKARWGPEGQAEACSSELETLYGLARVVAGRILSWSVIYMLATCRLRMLSLSLSHFLLRQLDSLILTLSLDCIWIFVAYFVTPFVHFSSMVFEKVEELESKVVASETALSERQEELVERTTERDDALQAAATSKEEMDGKARSTLSLEANRHGFSYFLYLPRQLLFRDVPREVSCIPRSCNSLPSTDIKQRRQVSECLSLKALPRHESHIIDRVSSYV